MNWYATGLAYLFDSLRSHLDQGSTVADIDVRTTTRGGYTDTAATWTAVKTAVPCIIQSKPDKDILETGQKRSGERAWFVITFAAGLGLSLNSDYRITIDGKRYFVSGYHRPTSVDMPTTVDCYEFLT